MMKGALSAHYHCSCESMAGQMPSPPSCGLRPRVAGNGLLNSAPNPTINTHCLFAQSTMRWPWTGKEDDKKSSVVSWVNILDPTNWPSSFTEPRALIPAIIFTATTVSGLRIYKTYLRRIPSVNHIKPGYFRRRSLFGRVTAVGDADNFRLFHTPGGRLAGWGWLKRVPTSREGLQGQTVRWPMSKTRVRSVVAHGS